VQQLELVSTRSDGWLPLTSEVCNESRHARPLARFIAADQSVTPGAQKSAFRDRVESTHRRHSPECIRGCEVDFRDTHAEGKPGAAGPLIR